MDETGWLDALRQACTDSSQAAVARRLKVSPAMISQVLNGVYRGDMARIQGLIEGVYCQKTVQCPVLGEIGLDVCLNWQAEPFKPVNPTRVKLFRACRGGCPHSKITQER